MGLLHRSKETSITTEKFNPLPRISIANTARRVSALPGEHCWTKQDATVIQKRVSFLRIPIRYQIVQDSSDKTRHFLEGCHGAEDAELAEIRRLCRPRDIRIQLVPAA
jgi:hypothetical protein